jgi:hypothetical protein
MSPRKVVSLLRVELERDALLQIMMNRKDS